MYKMTIVLIVTYKLHCKYLTLLIEFSNFEYINCTLETQKKSNNNILMITECNYQDKMLGTTYIIYQIKNKDVKCIAKINITLKCKYIIFRITFTSYKIY